MKKIVLISPAFKGSLHSNIKVLAIPPLNLALLASYTPEHYEVEIVDEAVEELDFDKPADLVGITCMTPLAPRAYEIAAEYRRRGVPVVMGGIHVSYMPQEALNYADCVVIGEAENTWATVLADFEAGKMQKIYHCERPDIENLRAPRRDLLRGKYFVETVQTGRGCPIGCNFCSVTQIAGRRVRRQPHEATIETLRRAKAAGVEMVMFTSDNFNKIPGVKDLLQQMIDEDLAIPSFVQCDAMIADDEELTREERREYANTLDSEVDRMAQLITNLLQLSRIQLGNLSAQRTFVRRATCSVTAPATPMQVAPSVRGSTFHAPRNSRIIGSRPS